MDIKREIKCALHALGFDKPRKHQVAPIKALTSRQDTIVIAGTSAGKTTIYQTAGLVLQGLTVVIEPLLALIYNQVKELQRKGIPADYIDSTRTKADMDKILCKAQKGKLAFLYVTPERLQNKSFISAMRQTNLALLVVGECHCITEWGYTFRDAYLCIGDFIQNLPNKPVICACSATILEGSVDTITQSLHMRHPAVFCSDLKRNNLILLKKDVTSPKRNLEKRLESRLKALKHCIKKYRDDGAIMIYALTTAYVDAIYNFLEETYPGQVARYHAKIQPEKLKRQMEMDFLQGKKKIMVATSAFGMGIDVPDIELIIHFNAPVSMTDYIQQVGRAGRDGRKARCILFYDQNGDDQKIVHSLRKKTAQTSKKAADTIKAHYQQMQDFLSDTSCMRNAVLHYQGQNEQTICKCCTNCARERKGR